MRGVMPILRRPGPAQFPAWLTFSPWARGRGREKTPWPAYSSRGGRWRCANGCVANLTARRGSPERMRKIRVFSGGAATSYISLDYRAQEGFIYRIARSDEEESSLLKKLLYAKDSTIVSEFGGKRIVRQPVPIAKEEPLTLELTDFIRCVRALHTPLVRCQSAK